MIRFITLGFLLYSGILYAERFSFQTELDQVFFIDRLLETHSDRYRLYVIDDFESNHYFVFDPPSPLCHLEIVYKNPGLTKNKEKKRAFEIEQVMVSGWGNTNSFERSLMFHYSVDIPGKQHFRIIPKEDIYILGRPFRFSLWIYSHNYSDILYLIFKTSRHQILKVKIGALNWQGWKRVEKQFPKNFYYMPKLNKPKSYYVFYGFFIQTKGKSEAGNREILFDHLLIISDIQRITYPGAEILDNF